jgi:hypothetical protein
MSHNIKEKLIIVIGLNTDMKKLKESIIKQRKSQ